jgi:HlyD family secretion protein
MKRAIFILLLAVLGVAAYYLYPRWFPQKPAETEIRLSGNVEAHESLVSFKVTGRIVELPIEEGQAVAAGQLLARLDGSDYRQQVNVDQASVRVRDSQLQLALAGSRSQDIDAAYQNVLDAQADLQQKKKDFARYDELYRKDEIPGQVRDQAQTAVERAQANVDRLRQIHNKLEEGTRKEQIAVEQATLRQAQQTLGLSRIRLGYTELTAPLAGVILVRDGELGEVVSPGAPVVTLADLDNVWVRVYLPETDLGRVRLGQEVSVGTDTFPGKRYRGHVSFISSEAEFTPKTVQTEKERVTLVYRIKVDVENPNHELKPGMPADVYIPLQ